MTHIPTLLPLSSFMTHHRMRGKKTIHSSKQKQQQKDSNQTLRSRTINKRVSLKCNFQHFIRRAKHRFISRTQNSDVLWTDRTSWSPPENYWIRNPVMRNEKQQQTKKAGTKKTTNQTPTKIRVRYIPTSRFHRQEKLGTNDSIRMFRSAIKAWRGKTPEENPSKETRIGWFPRKEDATSNTSRLRSDSAENVETEIRKEDGRTEPYTCSSKLPQFLPLFSLLSFFLFSSSFSVDRK